MARRPVVLGCVAAALTVVSPITLATSFTFTPTSVTETFTDGELFDDDLDVRGFSERVTTLRGVSLDDVTWTYQYTKGGPGYIVLSDDEADIDSLSLSGSGTSGARATVTLRFSDPGGNLIGPEYRFTNVSVAGSNPVIRDDSLSGALEGDDVLGNLQGFKIGDFRINVQVTSGQFELIDVEFDWEAGDIEPIPEASTITLLGLGIGAIGLINYRLRRLR